MAYSRGLHDLGDGCHAWLQPDGGWGWSNSGLVTGGGASLLVDTLFDLVTTRQMLDGIRPLTDRAPLTTVVNTHSDGDHCFGNELVASPGVEIIASDAAAAAQVASALGRGIGALVNAHDPETVSVSGLAASLLAAAPDAVHQAYLAALMRFRRASPPALLPSSLGDLGTLTGAAELVFDGFLTARGLTAWAAAKTP